MRLTNKGEFWERTDFFPWNNRHPGFPSDEIRGQSEEGHFGATIIPVIGPAVRNMTLLVWIQSDSMPRTSTSFQILFIPPKNCSSCRRTICKSNRTCAHTRLLQQPVFAIKILDRNVLDNTDVQRKITKRRQTDNSVKFLPDNLFSRCFQSGNSFLDSFFFCSSMHFLAFLCGGPLWIPEKRKKKCWYVQRRVNGEERSIAWSWWEIQGQTKREVRNRLLKAWRIQWINTGWISDKF